MERLIKFLISNKAVLIAAIMSLMTQLWHSVRAFVMLDVGGSENTFNYLFGILFSVSTSFAILLFTVRGRKNLAYFFLAVEVFINVIHYSVMNMNGGSLLIATIFMCIIVPVTIAVYSSEIDPDEYPVAVTPSPAIEAPKVILESDFLKEVNSLIGFDITNASDKSGTVPESTKAELRKLWKLRTQLNPEELKFKIQEILKEGPALFRQL